MNKITSFAMSSRMAYLILTGFAIILAAAVTLKVNDNGRTNSTYAKENTAAKQKNITNKNTYAYTPAYAPEHTQSPSLATSQEIHRAAGNSTPDMSSTKTPGKSATGASGQKIPCAWSDISITPEDFNLICTTVYCEAGNQSIETQIMTALTILNRLSSEDYPDTVKEVIYQDSQYSVTEWKGFGEYGWTSSAEQAVTYALEVNEHPKDMYFFRTKHYHKFGQPYKVSDDLYFSTAEQEADNENNS